MGKTIQAISVLQYLFTECRNRGPFLVIVPLSTIGQWRREIETWTGEPPLAAAGSPRLEMNVVMHHGSAEARDVIHEREFFFSSPAKPAAGLYKFNVLLTTYDMVMADQTRLCSVPWEYMVVDEGHRMKNQVRAQTTAVTLAQLRLSLEGVEAVWRPEALQVQVSPDSVRHTAAERHRRAMDDDELFRAGEV